MKHQWNRHEDMGKSWYACEACGAVAGEPDDQPCPSSKPMPSPTDERIANAREYYQAHTIKGNRIDYLVSTELCISQMADYADERNKILSERVAELEDDTIYE